MAKKIERDGFERERFDKWDWFFFGMVMGTILAFLVDDLLFHIFVKPLIG